MSLNLLHKSLNTLSDSKVHLGNGKKQWRKKKLLDTLDFKSNSHYDISRKKFFRPMREDIPFRIGHNYAHVKDRVHQGKGYVTVAGHTYLKECKFINAADNTTGFKFYEVELNPSIIPCTRLQQFARLFEMWRLATFRFSFEHTYAQTFSGSAVMAYDFDVNDSWGPSSGTPTVQKAENAQIHNLLEVGKDSSCSISRKQVRGIGGWMYTDPFGPEPRKRSIGKFYIIVKSQFLGSDGVTALTTQAWGNLSFDYTIDFSIASLEDVLTGTGAMWTGGGTMDGAKPYGDAPVVKSWGNLPFIIPPTGSSPYIDVPIGTYVVAANVTGTGISGIGATPACATGATPTKISEIQTVSGTTSAGRDLVVYFPDPGRITFSATCTTITACTVTIASMPREAVSVSVKSINNQLNIIKGMLDRVKPTEEDKDTKSNEKLVFIEDYEVKQPLQDKRLVRK